MKRIVMVVLLINLATINMLIGEPDWIQAGFPPDLNGTHLGDGYSSLFSRVNNVPIFDQTLMLEKHLRFRGGTIQYDWDANHTGDSSSDTRKFGFSATASYSGLVYSGSVTASVEQMKSSTKMSNTINMSCMAYYDPVPTYEILNDAMLEQDFLNTMSNSFFEDYKILCETDSSEEYFSKRAAMDLKYGDCYVSKVRLSAISRGTTTIHTESSSVNHSLNQASSVEGGSAVARGGVGQSFYDSATKNNASGNTQNHFSSFPTDDNRCFTWVQNQMNSFGGVSLTKLMENMAVDPPVSQIDPPTKPPAINEPTKIRDKPTMSNAELKAGQEAYDMRMAAMKADSWDLTRDGGWEAYQNDIAYETYHRANAGDMSRYQPPYPNPRPGVVPGFDQPEPPSMGMGSAPDSDVGPFANLDPLLYGGVPDPDATVSLPSNMKPSDPKNMVMGEAEPPKTGVSSAVPGYGTLSVEVTPLKEVLAGYKRFESGEVGNISSKNMLDMLSYLKRIYEFGDYVNWVNDFGPPKIWLGEPNYKDEVGKLNKMMRYLATFVVGKIQDWAGGKATLTENDVAQCVTYWYGLMDGLIKDENGYTITGLSQTFKGHKLIFDQHRAEGMFKYRFGSVATLNGYYIARSTTGVLQNGGGKSAITLSDAAIAANGYQSDPSTWSALTDKTAIIWYPIIGCPPADAPWMLNPAVMMMGVSTANTSNWYQGTLQSSWVFMGAEAGKVINYTNGWDCCNDFAMIPAFDEEIVESIKASPAGSFGFYRKIMLTSVISTWRLVDPELPSYHAVSTYPAAQEGGSPNISIYNYPPTPSIRQTWRYEGPGPKDWTSVCFEPIRNDCLDNPDYKYPGRPMYKDYGPYSPPPAKPVSE